MIIHALMEIVVHLQQKTVMDLGPVILERVATHNHVLELHINVIELMLALGIGQLQQKQQKQIAMMVMIMTVMARVIKCIL